MVERQRKEMLYKHDKGQVLVLIYECYYYTISLLYDRHASAL